ncbi:MAG: right-handed parallel beta-helix repeat-containing protein [Algoriphagus sp.]|uniref:right-handed parallel beta-helix repeat-containing protein n=1 Tax=Algoriphagus sp. TaxID=1872435 RepID=UPI002732183A|nr:right-handed parallel beta-helix repeat-containing protein [Algoriphagus sp.]MDP2042463.1 right-handed parallel beta-helix repeat-containing protein [Algoriphagus sp.]MDP3473509.1 right-handed parallel beta-helix repeat-containing protein [Algoriphagus sp.]
MKRIISNMLVVFLAFFSQLTLAQTTSVPNIEEIYINPEFGKDTNLGTRENPLATISQAAKMVNETEGEGSITIYLSAGFYGMSETADFNAQKWKFSATNRLTIRAEILPDEQKWSPAEMPILISIMPFVVEKNDKGETIGAQNFGLMFQNSHVTIQGIRILGQPVHENPSEGVVIRNYPIIWEGKDLEDLRVTQCLFIGSRNAVPNHLGILANGKTLEVDHCVFYGVKDAVVMWNSPATNSSFHHNLIVDSYGGAIWTWSTSSDFKFFNNAISNSNVVWILEKEEKESFTIDNSIIVGYNSLVNKGGGAQGFGEKGNEEKLKFSQDVILKKDGKLEIIEDQTNRNFLHIKPGTLGSNLGAGLFTKEIK